MLHLNGLKDFFNAGLCMNQDLSAVKFTEWAGDDALQKDLLNYHLV